MEEYISKNLTDAGTRYEHYQELKAEWEAGVEILKERKWLSPLQYEGLVKLTFGVELLNITLDAFSEYKDSDVEFKLQQQIDSIGNINQLTGRE